MLIVGKGLSREEFTQYVGAFDFGSIPPTSLVLHHTWRPRKTEWKGYSSVLSLKKYYEGLGWKAGPHAFVAEDKIWLFTPMDEIGIHAGEGNATWETNTGKIFQGFAKPTGAKLLSCSLGLEIVGDYDNEVWSCETYKNAVHVIKTLMAKLNISIDKVFFHRDFPSAHKSCPGTAITKDWVKAQLTDSVVCNHLCLKHCPTL